MLGAVAFTMIMVVVCFLLSWCIKGSLPGFVHMLREKSEDSSGRLVSFHLWKWDIAFRLNHSFWVRLAFLILGPAAVIGLSVSYAQLMPLRVVFVIYVLPAYLIMLVLGVIYPEWGKRAAVGFGAGIAATVVYDLVRLALVVALGLPDPIPHIGVLWLGADTVAHGDLWWVGYLWRFFGNGAGLGIAYAMLPKWWFSFKGGWLYGDLVGLGMFATLFFFPVAQAHLFILNFTVMINGILGHWAYGMAIGWIFKRIPNILSKFPHHEIKKQRPLTWRK